MTNEEFSNQFDVLISSYLTSVPLGKQDNRAFDEYEKSVFLTEAQDLLLQEFYTGYNATRDSYEKTELIRKYLSGVTYTKKYYTLAYISNLIKKSNISYYSAEATATLDLLLNSIKTEITKLNLDRELQIALPTTYSDIYNYLSNYLNASNVADNDNEIITNNSYIFGLPNDLWFATLEKAYYTSLCDSCIDGKEAHIVPTAQDEFLKIIENPFRGPTSRRVLRLDIKGNKVELVSKYQIGQYIIRYMKKPEPIILVTLGDGLTIKGKSLATLCELNDAIHKEILERAVQLALQSRAIYGKQE